MKKLNLQAFKLEYKKTEIPSFGMKSITGGDNEAYNPDYDERQYPDNEEGGIDLQLKNRP